jgi:putative transposase
LASQVLTYQFRLRDKHAAELNRQARAVNVVWNFCNETQQKAAKSQRPWLSAYALQRLTSGSNNFLDLHSHTIKRVCSVYYESRRRKPSPWLRWRGRKSLGWVPFNTGHVAFDGETFKFRGVRYEAMHLRALKAGVKIGAGSFNADGKGRWYLNVTTEVAVAGHAPATRVGMDLGLKDLATLSDGRKIEMPRFYRKSEAVLATAQRAKKTKRARAIHAKIANRRKDFMHKASAELTKEYGLIVIGDVSPSKMARTRMAKSVLDAGWADLKAKLSYKSIRNGGSCLEVSEHLTTQTCSLCGTVPLERPRGIAGLGIREWTCGDCGETHDRDVNAARNILRLGLETLGEGALYCVTGAATTPPGDLANKKPRAMAGFSGLSHWLALAPSDCRFWSSSSADRASEARRRGSSGPAYGSGV